MDNYRAAKDIGRFEPVGKKGHFGKAVIGEKDRKISGMMSMGLIIRIPVAAGACERISRVSDVTSAEFMQMKAMGTDRRTLTLGRLIRRQSLDFNLNSGSAGYIYKINGAAESGRQGAALHLGFDD